MQKGNYVTNEYDFMNFFSNTLIKKNVITLKNNQANINNEFAKSLRISTISDVNNSLADNSNKTEIPLQISSTQFNFFHEKFPHHIKFNVVSVDCQQSLWNKPAAKNGREYIQFLEKRFIKKYLNYGDTLYWNYDLGETVKKFIPKSVVHEIRDSKKKDKKDFL